jgi:preprotein translocase subunit SecF
MAFGFRQFISVLMVVLTLGAGIAPGQDHVVTAADLHKELLAAREARQTNLAKIDQLFTTDPGRKALAIANLSYERIHNAAALLSDEELARLALQAEKVHNDFVAGALSNQEITYILIAVGTAVVILLIVVAAR